jgi:hypothetical protein
MYLADEKEKAINKFSEREVHLHGVRVNVGCELPDFSG